MNQKYDVTSKPEKERLFTTSEVAKLAGISPASVRGICLRVGIDYQVNPTKNSRAAFYDYYAMQQIVEVAKGHKKESKAKAELNIVPTECAMEHPLVTDKRCLTLSYWPDVVPDCFKDIGE